jgi:hypothetical protein
VLYDKVKLLLALDMEPDMMVVLKTLCLMNLWCPESSGESSLNGAWQVTGTATRLAMQSGMHREDTYADRPNSKDRRKLWWYLYVRLVAPLQHADRS